MQSLLITLLIIIFGSLLVKIIIKDLKTPLVLATGFIVGIGLVTFTLFATSWLGLKITNSSLWNIVLILSALVIVAFRFLKRNIEPVKLKGSRTEVLGWSLVFGVLLLSLLMSIYYPITAWDALALYDFRAKVIASLGFFVQISSQYSYFSHYPVHTSLMHTIIYLTGNLNPQFLYSAYLISFSIIFYSFLRYKVKNNIALISIIILITTPDIFEHSTIAYTNLPYTVVYVSGLLYLFFALIKNRDDYLFLSSIIIGLSTWIRSDLPFWITGILFAAIYSIKAKRLKPLIIYLAPFLIIQQTWNHFASTIFGNGYSTSGQISDAGISLFTNLDLGRVFEVLDYVYKNVISTWGPLLILFVISVIVNLIKKRNNSLVLLSIIVVNLIGLYVGTYVFSFKVAEWKEIADSATRMAMFFPPLIIFYVSMVISDNN